MTFWASERTGSLGPPAASTRCPPTSTLPWAAGWGRRAISLTPKPCGSAQDPALHIGSRPPRTYARGVDLLRACSVALILPLAILTLQAAVRRRRAHEFWVLMAVSAGISYLVRLLDVGWALVLGVLLQAAVCAVGLTRFRQEFRSED